MIEKNSIAFSFKVGYVISCLLEYF